VQPCASRRQLGIGELIQAYSPHIKLSVADREDGWILMTAQRGAAA
jgi:hypothetical protein